MAGSKVGCHPLLFLTPPTKVLNGQSLALPDSHRLSQPSMAPVVLSLLATTRKWLMRRQQHTTQRRQKRLPEKTNSADDEQREEWPVLMPWIMKMAAPPSLHHHMKPHCPQLQERRAASLKSRKPLLILHKPLCRCTIFPKAGFFLF